MLHNLNLACGTDIRQSTPEVKWTNLDLAMLPGVDLAHDLRRFPWPFPDHTFDRVIAHDIIEHLPETVATMEELWRVLKPGGIVEFRIPYFNSIHMFNDPTHQRFFNENTLQFFDVGSAFRKARPYYTTACFRRVSLEISVGFLRRSWRLREGFLQRLILKLSKSIGDLTQVMWVTMRAEVGNG
ncbi:MAG: methyltransferase domain-containing protein [Chlorobi bacterium]|nr:methyltransferase domain-containing protein [Chlorobiota bacterium]